MSVPRPHFPRVTSARARFRLGAGLDITTVAALAWIFATGELGLGVMLMVSALGAQTLLRLGATGTLVRATGASAILCVYIATHRATLSGSESTDALLGYAVTLLCALLTQSEARAEVAREEEDDGPATLVDAKRFRAELDDLAGHRFAVMAMGIDGFRMMSQLWGAAATQAALRAVTAAILEVLGPKHVAARLDGDEFALLLPDAGPMTARTLADRLRSALHHPVGQYGQVTISVGWAVGGQTVSRDERPARLWKAAQEALEEARARGGDCAVAAGELAEGAHEVDSASRSQMLQRILSADAMRSVYQPIVDLQTRAVVGYEALARPEATPDDGDVSEIFSRAQQLGVLGQLDRICRRAGIAGARQMPLEIPLFLNVAVGSSPDIEGDARLMVEQLAEVGRTPDRVVLEVMDAGHVELGALVRACEIYRSFGFRIAMDDVDDHPRTLDLLKATRPDVVKLDRIVLGRTAVSVAALRTVVQIVDFAHATAAMLIGEGVETDEMVERIKRLGIAAGQGFHLGRPAPLPARSLAAETVVQPVRTVFGTN